MVEAGHRRLDKSLEVPPRRGLPSWQPVRGGWGLGCAGVDAYRPRGQGADVGWL